jgi:lysophospholipid acyltransferase 5
MFSHSFFVGGFFVGPQFSMKKFQNYIQRNINEDISSPNMFALKRLGLGCSYLLFHLIGDMYFPTDYVQTPEFDELNYFKKSIVFALWVKIILAKYISVWLMAEGTCILAGNNILKKMGGGTYRVSQNSWVTNSGDYCSAHISSI